MMHWNVNLTRFCGVSSPLSVGLVALFGLSYFVQPPCQAIVSWQEFCKLAKELSTAQEARGSRCVKNLRKVVENDGEKRTTNVFLATEMLQPSADFFWILHKEKDYLLRSFVWCGSEKHQSGRLAVIYVDDVLMGCADKRGVTEFSDPLLENVEKVKITDRWVAIWSRRKHSFLWSWYSSVCSLSTKYL